MSSTFTTLQIRSGNLNLSIILKRNLWKVSEFLHISIANESFIFIYTFSIPKSVFNLDFSVTLSEHTTSFLQFLYFLYWNSTSWSFFPLKQCLLSLFFPLKYLPNIFFTVLMALWEWARLFLSYISNILLNLLDTFINLSQFPTTETNLFCWLFVLMLHMVLLTRSKNIICKQFLDI